MPRTRPAVAASRRQISIALGSRIASARLTKGLSQKSVAVDLGLSQQAVARIELGQRTLSFIEALDLAALFGIDPMDLDPRNDKPA